MTIKYKTIKINEKISPEIAELIFTTYQTFNCKEGNKKAISDFLSQYDNNIHSPEDLSEKFKKSNINFGAFSGKKLVGIIRGKNNRIINLFVDGKFHNYGIGKKLVSLFEKQAIKEGSKFIKIRASLYTVGFYSKCGYKKTTGKRLFHGLNIQPLKKKFE